MFDILLALLVSIILPNRIKSSLRVGVKRKTSVSAF